MFLLLLFVVLVTCSVCLGYVSFLFVVVGFGHCLVGFL